MPRVQVRTYVDEEVRDRFTKRFGGEYSAISFTLESAMREVLDMTEGQPDMEDLVRQGIRNYVLRNQAKNPEIPNVNSTTSR